MGGAKVDKFTEQVKNHNCLMEPTYRPEQNVAAIRRNVEPLNGRMGR